MTALETAAANVRSTTNTLEQIEAQGNSVPDEFLDEWLRQHNEAFNAARAAERALIETALGQDVDTHLNSDGTLGHIDDRIWY